MEASPTRTPLNPQRASCTAITAPVVGHSSKQTLLCWSMWTSPCLDPWNWVFFGTASLCALHVREIERRGVEGLGFFLSHHLAGCVRGPRFQQNNVGSQPSDLLCWIYNASHWRNNRCKLQSLGFGNHCLQTGRIGDKSTAAWKRITHACASATRSSGLPRG